VLTIVDAGSSASARSGLHPRFFEPAQCEEQDGVPVVRGGIPERSSMARLNSRSAVAQSVVVDADQSELGVRFGKVAGELQGPVRVRLRLREELPGGRRCIREQQVEIGQSGMRERVGRISETAFSNNSIAPSGPPRPLAPEMAAFRYRSCASELAVVCGASGDC